MSEKRLKNPKELGIVPRLLFNNILITAEQKILKSNLILPGGNSDGVYDDIQVVVEVGDGVSKIEVGDYILLKVTNFIKRKTNSLKQDIVQEYQEVELPIHEIGEKEYMLITDRDVVYFWKHSDIKEL